MDSMSCIVLLLLALINEGSLEKPIVGVIGGSVVLPCSSKKQQTIQNVLVNWKHNDVVNVYHINKGKGSVEQDTTYINRTESFPEEYLNGNFSLKLNNLQYSDKGKYQCYIIEESTFKTVELLIKVPRQLPIKGRIGDSVVLPCSSRETQRTIEDVTVSWSHSDSLNVFDIIKGKVNVEKLDSPYKNRTETFPEEYLNGNFSLKLNNLQYSDTGEYQCLITNELVIESVKLEVNQGAQSRPKKILLSAPLLYILLFI